MTAWRTNNPWLAGQLMVYQNRLIGYGTVQTLKCTFPLASALAKTEKLFSFSLARNMKPRDLISNANAGPSEEMMAIRDILRLSSGHSS